MVNKKASIPFLAIFLVLILLGIAWFSVYQFFKVKSCDLQTEQLNNHISECRNNTIKLEVENINLTNQINTLSSQIAYCEGAKAELEKRQILGGVNIFLEVLLIIFSILLGKSFEENNNKRWIYLVLSAIFLIGTIFISISLGW